MHRPLKPLRLTCALVLAGAGVSAQAATCIASTSALAFGVYDTTLLSANDSAATVTVTCTPGVGNPLTTSYTITIAGTGSGNDSVRSVAAGGYRLYYQLYKDSPRSVVWGNGSSSGSGVASSVTSATTVTPAAQVHTVYARMPARQVVAPGIFSGNVLVTVEY